MKSDAYSTMLFIVFNVISSVFTSKSNNNTVITVIEGGSADLPCNMTLKKPDDSVTLILWFKEDAGGAPIYTVDVRSNFHEIETPKHFTSDFLANRASFNFSSNAVQQSVLRLEPVRDDDNGLYKCRVDFRFARTMTTVTILNVIVPPRNMVIMDRSGHEYNEKIVGPFNEATDVSIICRAEGVNKSAHFFVSLAFSRPPPSILWYRDNSLLDESFDKIGDESSLTVENELNLERVGFTHLNSVLKCVAKNNKLTLPLEITRIIDVNLSPKTVQIIRKPNPISAGRKLEVLCETTGSRPMAQIKWFKNNKTIEHSRESFIGEKNTTLSALIFTPNADDDGSQIICVAENAKLKNTSIEDRWKLQVFYDPKLTLVSGVNTKVALIKEGDVASLRCIVKANPFPDRIHWLFDGSDLQVEDGLYMNNTHLVFEKTTHQRVGKYQCSATNIEGKSFSNTLTIEIHFAPYCKEGQKTIYEASIGESLTISCKVLASPADVAFFWTFNSSVKTDQFYEQKYHLNSSMLKYNSDGLTSTLMKSLSSEADFGTYECYARNFVGSQLEPCLYTIVPSGPPEALHDCSVVNHTITTISIDCTAGYDGGLQQQFVLEVYEYRREHLISSITRTEMPLFNIGDLLPETTYLFVIYSKNSRGKSQIISLVTQTDAMAALETVDEQMIDESFIRLLKIIAIFIFSIIIVIIILLLILRISKQEETCETNRNKRIEQSLETDAYKTVNCFKSKLSEQSPQNPDVIPVNSDTEKCVYSHQVIDSTYPTFQTNIQPFQWLSQQLISENKQSMQFSGSDPKSRKYEQSISQQNYYETRSQTLPRRVFQPLQSNEEQQLQLYIDTMHQSSISLSTGQEPLPLQSRTIPRPYNNYRLRNSYFTGNSFSGFSTPV